jgi:UDP-N-acetylmuramoyl-tripeptide--D-alanyl-D-alanine ligase
VLESERNLNNHFGLPLSLLRLGPEADVGVFEMGMSAPGEIRLLAELAAPDVGVVTNVGPVHLEFFPDVDAIARAKFELIETLPPRAWAVLNADDPRVRAFADRVPGCCITFGISEQANFQARDLETDPMGGTYFTLPAQSYEGVPSGVVGSAHGGLNFAAGDVGRDVRFHLPMLGRHNVLNVLSALAVCHAFGIPAVTLQDAVAELRPAPMRGEVVRLSCGAIVVNDCYNSNPDALEQMLTAVHSIPARRRFAVLGGMKELGPASKSLHQRSGRRIPELGFDLLLTVGEEARDILEAACAAGMPPRDVAHFDSPDKAGVYLREILREGDVVLLKASRAVHLEKVWDALQSIAAPDGAPIQESVSAKGAL